MNFIAALFNAVIGFIRRNPITCLVVLILAVAAPAVLKGIAIFILYLILGVVVLSVVLAFFFRRRVNKMRRQMEDQFQSQGGYGSDPFAGGQRSSATQEGDVKVYKTEDTPEKRVSKNVGDYVEFEETKEK